MRSGKTAIPLTVGQIRCELSLILLPLIGLGCDLVEKTLDVDRGVEAYHLDEHRDKADVLPLKNRFLFSVRVELSTWAHRHRPCLEI
jgi:hypothetical protein